MTKGGNEQLSLPSSAREKLYIVFDVLPRKKDGGLVGVYARFVEEFKDEFDITLVSVFRYPSNDIEVFSRLKIITLFDVAIDNRFFRLFSYLRDGKIGAFGNALRSLFAFSVAIPIVRKRSIRVLVDGMVIATSPAAAIFLSTHMHYMLEIHSSFEYFWGENALGRLQAQLMPVPDCTIFRNGTDAEKGAKLFPSDYIYNFIYDSNDVEKGVGQSDRCRALFVGRLSPEKNPLPLVRMAKEVRKRVPGFVLDVYGDGVLFDAVAAEIERLQASDIVQLHGYVDDATIYRGHSLLWVTSLFEGLPLSIIESFSWGIPVVTSRWGDATEEIVSEDVGCICETEEAFIQASTKLLTDDEFYQKCSRAARETYLSYFTPEAYRARWKRVFGKAGRRFDSE